MSVAVTSAMPVSDADPFTEENLLNPFPLSKKLRDLGPVVHLSRYDLYWMGRYDEVRTALRDWETWSSAQGIGLNPIINEAWEGALIHVDPPVHTEMRKLITDSLGPRHLAPIQDTIARRADELADRLVERGDFDAVADFAHDLPVNVIMDLIGWPEYVRPRLIDMAVGSFDCCGPQNERMMSSIPQLEDMMATIGQVYDEGSLTPGGFGSVVADAGKAGHIPRQDAIALLAGYVVAAFDTTINAMASGIWLFAENPGQFDLLRDDPSLVAGAFNEIVRLESPLQHFSRVATRDVEVAPGVGIPEGARAVMSYSAANRDERHYEDPDHFDITRRNSDHVGFGFGTHSCAGQGLAKLEGNAVFTALAQRVKGVEITGEPERIVNNITRGFTRLPARLIT